MVLGGLILAIIAVFLPPLAVIIRKGCGVDLLINIVLCFLAWIPGVLHAWYIILRYSSHSERQRVRRERERVYERRRSGSRNTGRRSYDRRSYEMRDRYAAPPAYHEGRQQTGYVSRKY